MNDSFYVDATNTPEVKDKAGNVTVPCDRGMLCLKDLSRKKLLDFRKRLESLYGNDKAMEGFPGGDNELRQGLRALRYCLGPNSDRSSAIDWPVLGLVVGEVDLQWCEQDGPKNFHATVNSVDKWKERAKAEMKLFRENVWKVTWGKINLRFAVTEAPCPLTELSANDRVGKRSFEPLLKNVRNRIMCVFVFAPKDGKGERPSTYEKPFAIRRPLVNGAYAIWLPASEDRMSTEGQFAGLECFRASKGMPHEFWHTVRHLLKGELSLPKEIFLPDIDSRGQRGRKNRRDFQKVKNEVAELGICLSEETRLEEYYAMWPTLRQCQQLADFYSP